MGQTTPKIFRLQSRTAEQLEEAAKGTGMTQVRIVEDALALYQGEKPDGVESRQRLVREWYRDFTRRRQTAPQSGRGELTAPAFPDLAPVASAVRQSMKPNKKPKNPPTSGK